MMKRDVRCSDDVYRARSARGPVLKRCHSSCQTARDCKESAGTTRVFCLEESGKYSSRNVVPSGSTPAASTTTSDRWVRFRPLLPQNDSNADLDLSPANPPRALALRPTHVQLQREKR